MAEKYTRVSRKLTSEQRRAYDNVREEAKHAFPPLQPASEPSGKGRIALAIRQARKARGLTFEQLAERSGIGSAELARDIEYGGDAKVSDIAAIAAVLGLRLELVANQSG